MKKNDYPKIRTMSRLERVFAKQKRSSIEENLIIE